MKSMRDDFTAATRSILAKRAGFLCSICRALTVGPSSVSPSSVTNLGVAAHICGASPGGARYDHTMSSSERSDIINGIWLCQNDAKLIDSDIATWTKERLMQRKYEHEQYVISKIGQGQVLRSGGLLSQGLNRVEYAFLRVGDITMEAYRRFITPILVDKSLDENSELGLLMFGEQHWTVFVDPGWLRWRIMAHEQGYKVPQEVPPNLIYGQIPGFPDSFLEFLMAIVESNSTFVWHRHPGNYLVLAQPQRVSTTKV